MGQNDCNGSGRDYSGAKDRSWIYVLRRMLNGRLYRAALVPVVCALAIAAFSLMSRPRPLTARLAPDAFQGSSALAQLKSLAAAYPDRRPGSIGDERLAGRIVHDLEGLGGTAGGGFSVQRSRFS